MYDIPNADAYGVVLINAKGEVLLREPSGHFGGYVWTFAKGRPDPGETPAKTAIREAFEETGYHVELLDVIPEAFPGTTTSSAFFLAGPIGKQGKPTNETSATRWVGFDEAADLISQTRSKTGRDRDLAILRAARDVLERLAWDRRPATCKEDWETKPFPRKRTEVALDLSFDEAAMARVRKGFLPTVMEEKWFAWFEEPVLHLHRSWTGVSIYQVRFEKSANGWRAVSAKVNRNPEQYSETDDEADQRQIADLIGGLLVNGPTGPRTDPFAEMLIQASQPNYLGSPSVVFGLIQRVMEAAVAYFKGETNFNAVWDLIWNMAQEIASGDDYVRMSGWHTPQCLGQALVRFMGVRPEEIFADDLDYFVSEALMALFLKARDLLNDFADDPVAQWNPHALEQLNQLHYWAVQVFLGTNELEHSSLTLAEFRWRPVAVDGR
ncbi:NUDIX hydrolase [Gemmobacter nectariphilus]|uniref:NUDIX hydrolase n=1 Tax=Gemmobacter nectariphilus TaxID=220343 RepID=UPI00041455B9|nr:NUDIX hydrolase [Gemmobacter nectariphilus]